VNPGALRVRTPLHAPRLSRRQLRNAAVAPAAPVVPVPTVPDVGNALPLAQSGFTLCCSMLDCRYQYWYISGMNEYEVRLLETALEFLRGLPPKLRMKAYRGVELLETFGPDLSMPHARPLRNAEGLRELRVKFASDIVRLFYFHHEGKVYIVASGFVKKSDKTDPRELRRAIRLMHMFKEGAP